MLVFVEGGKPENLEKNPRSKVRTNNKLNSKMMPGPEPGLQWWEVSALTTAPSLLPTSEFVVDFHPPSSFTAVVPSM